MTAASPSRDDGGTTLARCPSCARTFRPVGRQAYCCPACRKRAFRRRHAAALPPLTPARRRRDHTVYECGGCGQRRLGEQRCAECGLFGRAVGLGGACPACDEPVTLADLDLAVLR